MLELVVSVIFMQTLTPVTQDVCKMHLMLHIYEQLALHDASTSLLLQHYNGN